MEQLEALTLTQASKQKSVFIHLLDELYVVPAVNIVQSAERRSVIDHHVPWFVLRALIKALIVLIKAVHCHARQLHLTAERV